MRIRKIVFLTALLFIAAQSSPVIGNSALNVLVNPSFEDGGKGWSLWGAEIAKTARSGKAGLSVRNTEAKWSGADYIVVLPEEAAKVIVSGWIKTDSVISGAENWEKARISVELRDAMGERVGGYPPPVGQVEGTSGWTHYSREYRVPKSVKTVFVQCALGNATGTAHFDDLSVVIRDRKGETLPSGRLSGVMDYGEWYALKAKPGATGSHYVDWSGLLDAPAGKHGFLQIKDGGLFFENGTPAKFWGTNLVAKDIFASDAQIDSAVSRLAKMGANMLRLHHMDAPWTNPNIFGNTKGTRKLSKKSMRQLDYLIAMCKERGIYIFLDFLVHRDFTKEDGVEHTPPDLGGKQVGFFNKRIIELQKEYNENLLNHVNQFTGVAYKDEPAIAASAFINESTIFCGFSSDMLTPPYRLELEEQWKEWLAKQEAGQAGSVNDNGNDSDSGNGNAVSDTAVAADGETVTDPSDTISTNINIKQLATFNLDYVNDRPRLKARAPGAAEHESIRFLSDIEVSYFKTMRNHFRSVGGKYPIAGSNMPLPLLAMLRNNSRLDFICSNDYWDHPQVWKIGNDWDNILTAPFNNRSQLRNLRASAIQNKSYYRVDNMPFFITEWNHCYPNEYVLEGVPLIAAYGALQGWNGILQFDFNLETFGIDRLHSYKLSTQPEHAALWVMAAPLFLRGDVLTAPGQIVENITEEQANNVPSYSDMLENNYHLPFITKVAKTFDGNPQGDIKQYDKYFDRNSGVIRSETGELTVNEKTGYMMINAPKVQGASGFVGGIKFDFPLFTYEIANKHASVFAVSADGAALDKSKRFYLIAVGPTKMKDQTYDPARNTLENIGAGDILVQVIDGKITFKKIGGKKMQIFPLEPDGKRGKAMRLKKGRGSAGTLEFNKGRTLVYEVVVK